jgi:iron uptake system component EfeO
MKLHKKVAYTALTLSLLTVPALAACSNTTSTSKDSASVQSSKKQSGKNTLKSHVQMMQATLKDLQGALGKNDTEKVKQYGKKLNDQWLSYENDIREKYPLLYTDAEKYLQPLYTEVTMDNLDSKKVQELSVQLERSLSNLANAKETATKTSEALKKAVADYKGYVDEQTTQLVTATKSFTDAVKAKDMEKAKALYAEARVYYERIEPIAESFGDLDPKIDARENDVDASEWSGFHRIEKALWKDSSLEGMDKYADQLNQDVTELQKKMKAVKLDPTQVVAGSIELLNEAAISKITGEEERYSHIDIMDFASNVEGSQAVYHAILPALNEKNPQLAQQLDTEFNKLTTLLGKYKQNNSYVNYTQLTKDQIRELSQQLSALSESMAQTAEIFQ